MKLEEVMNQKQKLLEEVQELDILLEEITKGYFEFEGVTCLVEEITQSTKQVELISQRVVGPRFRNGKYEMFISIKEFQEKSIKLD